jgi:Zn-finger nucleic acid-binding protein
MNCPSCGAPMQADGDSFKCGFCHTVVVPDKNDEGVRILSEAPGQACPVCSIPLMQASLASVPLLYCTQCKGMLISMDVFQTLIAAMQSQLGSSVVQPPVDLDDLRRAIACPHCHHPMEAHSYAGPGNVILDSCENCSLNWLDHGKLARIAHAPDDRGPSPDFDATY